MTDDGITLTADRWKVSSTEKISTGEFENANPHTTIEGSIPVHNGRLTPERRKELKARLLALHKDVQEVVQRAAENRVREPGHEDWGVRAGDDTHD